MDSDNEKREIEGLLEAMDHLNLQEGMIVTFDQEDLINSDGKTIQMIPAWKLDDLEIWR